MTYQLALSKIEIEFPVLPIAMMGYGDWRNRITGVSTPLFARCLLVQESNQTLYYVHIEIGNIQPALRKEVIDRIQKDYPQFNLNEHNLIIVAQHTHSAPSGYSEYAFYNFTTPGHRTEIFEAYVQAIVSSIVQAYENKFEGYLTLKEGSFNEKDEVAWNRSLKAYNANPENESLTEDKAHLALDRKMLLLQVEDLKGNIKGSLNWFGVHTTSVGPKNTKVSYDNKGYAAESLEKEIANSVHIFSQAKAGDVSPHYHGKNQIKKRKETFKKGDDKHAQNNGNLQFKKAQSIIEHNKGEKVDGKIKAITKYSDFTAITVNPKYANNLEGRKTSEACFGASFFQGTEVDGPGISPFLKEVIVHLNGVINKKRKDLKESQGTKDIILNASSKEMFGKGKLNILPGFIDPQIKEMHQQSRRGAIKENTLVPTVLPLQFFILGDFAIVGLPGEITTTAGNRLEKSIMEGLAKLGIKRLVLSSYANSYMGYITTFEEYQLQLYEGGHTIFGQWTLGAFQTKFDELISSLAKDDFEQNQYPPEFSKEELDKRTY